MSARIIQVPMAPDLLDRISRHSQRRFPSRAAFIRAACENYLQLLETALAEKRYVEGYTRQREDPRIARASAKLAAKVLPDEDWQ